MSGAVDGYGLGVIHAAFERVWNEQLDHSWCPLHWCMTIDVWVSLDVRIINIFDPKINSQVASQGVGKGGGMVRVVLERVVLFEARLHTLYMIVFQNHLILTSGGIGILIDFTYIF